MLDGDDYVVARAGIEPATFRFQAKFWLTPMFFTWSYRAAARELDPLEHPDRRYGPVLAHAVGSKPRTDPRVSR